MADQVLADSRKRVFRRTPYLVAWVTLAALFPLVLVGAGVTSKDAGMAYPDWPTSSGHLVNPPQWWQGEATRWEHGHRLIGWFVGMSAIVLVATTWRTGGAARWLALGTLLAISAQGILGGMRVTEVSTTLAMLHGIWGQVCFCLASLTVLVTSPGWYQLGRPLELRSGRALPRLAMVVTGAIFVQLVLGAALRHFSGGHLLVAHVLWAMPVVFLCGWWVMWVLGLGVRSRLLTRMAQIVGLLVTVQLMLGGLSWLVTLAGIGASPWLVWMVPSAHVGVGALLLASCVVLSTLVFRIIGRSAESVGGWRGSRGDLLISVK